MRSTSLVGWGLLGLACGGAARPVVVAKPAPVEVAPETERRPYAEEALLPKPAALDGVWLHVSSLSRSFDQLPTLVKGLPGLAPLAELVTGRGSILPPDVAAVIDASQPIDFVMPLGADDAPTLSFRVRSAEAIETGAVGLTLTRLESGVWNIGSLAGVEVEPPPAHDDAAAPPDDEEEPEEETPELGSVPMHCQILHLPAPQGFRVLCSRGSAPSEYSRSFLLATERDVAQPSDAHLELAGDGYRVSRDLLMQSITQRVTGTGTQDSGERAGEQLAQNLFGALLEHEKLSLDVSLSNLHVDAQLDLAYGASPSMPGLSQWLTQGSQAKLPTSYARLPADGALALGLSLGPDVAPYIISAFESSIDEDTITSAAAKKEMLEAMRGVLPQDGRASFAMGLDVPAALTALDSPAVRLADDADKPLSPAAVQQLQAALGGWIVIGLDEPPARYLAAVKRAYRVGKMQSKPRPGHELKNRRSFSNLVSLSGAPRGLPHDTLHIVSAERPNRKYVAPEDGSKPAQLPFDDHILVVPDGERVWIVCARSEALAVEQAQVVLATSPQARLGAGEPATLFAASTQVALFAVADVDGDSKIQRQVARHRLATVNRAPSQAHGTVPLTLQVLPRSDAPGWRLHFHGSAQLDELLAESLALVQMGD